MYFTWPDRGLSYECRGCGACCKGLGVGLDSPAGEVDRLVEHYPPVVAFLRRRGDTTTAFNPRDRCWFLADDGLCRVEVEHGRSVKPASCRLFPFNRVFRIGDVTVVDYNSVICPLRASQSGVTHAEILAEIEGIRDAAIVGTSLPSDDPQFLAREQAIAAACFAGTIEMDAVEGFEVLAGVPWRAPSGETLSNALVLTPSMRFNELYGPRQYAKRTVIAEHLPRMWRAWLGFAALGAELAQRALGLQELTTIWSEQAPLAYALARWNDPATLAPGPIELPGSDPGGTVKKLAQACIDNRKAKRSFGALATPLLEARPLAERAAIVKLAEPLLRTIWR